MATRNPRRNRPETTPRHVWLAALGVAAVARREAATAAAIARGEWPRLRADAARFAMDARDVARGIALTVQEQAAPRLARAGDALQALLRHPGRRHAPGPRRASRTPAGGTRSAAGRRQAEGRIARRGR